MTTSSLSYALLAAGVGVFILTEDTMLSEKQERGKLCPLN